MLNKQNLQENTFSFLSQTILCKKHHTQAKSICFNCGVYFCLNPTCGQEHIYHNVESLDLILNSHIFPFLRNYLDLNKQENDSAGMLSSLNIYQNNLKEFAVQEKRKLDDLYKKAQNQLNLIYNSFLEEVNEFIEDIAVRFESLHEKINSQPDCKYLLKLVSQITDYLNEKLKTTYNNNEAFILSVAKDAKALNARLHEAKVKSSNLDFNSEINEIKTFAEKEYNNVNKINYFKELQQKLENDHRNITEARMQRLDQTNQSIMYSKSKRMLSFALNKTELNIDIDLFVRDLAALINTVRVEPQQGLSIIDQYLTANEEVISDNSITSKIKEMYNYISGMGIPLAPLEWDNDLSNSADDYLKRTHGKLESYTSVKERMRDIIAGYYQHHNNVQVVTYIGIPNIQKILFYILLHKEFNFIYDQGINQIGICAVDSPVKKNAVVLIINLSYLKNNKN
jgi:hypothetical protein